MSKDFDFDAFKKVSRVALSETMCWKSDNPALSAFDTKGPAFDFGLDGGVDSLDMLDVVFSIEKQLNIKTNLGSEAKSMTLEDLYNSFRHQPAM